MHCRHANVHKTKWMFCLDLISTVGGVLSDLKAAVDYKEEKKSVCVWGGLGESIWPHSISCALKKRRSSFLKGDQIPTTDHGLISDPCVFTISLFLTPFVVNLEVQLVDSTSHRPFSITHHSSLTHGHPVHTNLWIHSWHVLMHSSGMIHVVIIHFEKTSYFIALSVLHLFITKCILFTFLFSVYNTLRNSAPACSVRYVSAQVTWRK